jgi:hypothetical protein
MNYSISADLQSRLHSLSSLVHEDKRSTGAKSSEVEEISNTILKKIYSENSNLPTSARLYLEKIASSIIDDKWSDIPKPVEMKFDFQILKGVADALALASVGIHIDLFELFGMLMKIKGDEAYNLSTISIMDTKLSLEIDGARFKEQERANQMELGAGIASGVLQCAQGTASSVSSGFSIRKNLQLAKKSSDTMDDGLLNSKFENELADFKQTRDKSRQNYNVAEKNLAITKEKYPDGHDAVNAAESTRDTAKKAFEGADTNFNRAQINVNKLNVNQKKLESSLTIKTDRARMWDQLRSGVIQGVKGGLDVGLAFVRLEASEAKLNADKYEAAKNTTDKSANAMSESSRKAAEDVKELKGRLDGILQMIDSSIKKQFL